MREIDQLKVRLAAQELTIERERRLRADAQVRAITAELADALARAITAERSAKQAQRVIEALRRQIDRMKHETVCRVFKG